MKETSTPKTARSSGGAKLQRSGDRPDRSRSPVKKDKDRARDSPAKSSQDGEIGETQQWEDPRNAIQVSSTRILSLPLGMFIRKGQRWEILSTLLLFHGTDTELEVLASHPR